MLVNELSQGAIARSCMGMSEADLAKAVLSGHFKLPKR
ncbi:hypothetical protein BTI_5257 [Burkholderia thailandensis MSMB121]|nr:hypothetical protein BTI_5257 [Burkholderia thailandensis MSMB121]